MRYPLDGTITITGKFREKAQPGTGLPDAQGVRRHIGTDFRAAIGTPVKSMEAGIVTNAYGNGKSNTVVEIKSGNRLRRYMHLSSFSVRIGQHVNEGQEIARSGNSGGVAAHLHVDDRVAGTAWNASLNNYRDPVQAIIDWINAQKASPNLPKVGTWIQLMPKDTRTTFKAGTAIQVGTIKVTDNTFKYLVRGHDPVYKNRVIINSASAGGNGVSLALYYLNGDKIANWKSI